MADYFDLQLFGDEGGDDAGVGSPAAGAEMQGGEQPPASGAPAAADSNTGGEQKPEAAGTILGGKEEEAGWDFREAVPEGMEYDEAAASAFATVAKEAGLTSAQAKTLAAYGMKYAQEGMAAMARSWAEEVNGWAAAAKTELGANFDVTVKRAGVGIEALEKVVPGIRQALDETGAGNKIEFVKAFALVGDLVGEDTFRGFGATAETKSARYPNTNFDNY